MARNNTDMTNISEKQFLLKRSVLEIQHLVSFPLQSNLRFSLCDSPQWTLVGCQSLPSVRRIRGFGGLKSLQIGDPIEFGPFSITISP